MRIVKEWMSLVSDLLRDPMVGWIAWLMICMALVFSVAAVDGVMSTIDHTYETRIAYMNYEQAKSSTGTMYDSEGNIGIVTTSTPSQFVIITSDGEEIKVDSRTFAQYKVGDRIEVDVYKSPLLRFESLKIREEGYRAFSD